VLGFWKDSPITLAKITKLLSGYFPDIRTGLALYLLIGGFIVTTFLYGRNIYCLYACPFGAAQRCVGVIGGRGFKLPAWSVRLMQRLLNVIVFVAVFIALLTLQPALASYEPFAVLFSLRGTTLQWLLLFVVLVVSLTIRTIRNPWCNFFCPMRSAELLLKEVRRAFRKGARVTSG
jgi:polyferredoxin